jgi:hypothetical protein
MRSRESHARAIGREGGAILLVVLSLLVLAGLSHGALVVALGEAHAAALGRERTALRLAAEGIRDAWIEAPVDFPGPGELRWREASTPEGRTMALSLWGVGPGVALVEVSAAEGPGRGHVLARGVGRVVDAPGLAAEARVPAMGLFVLLPGSGVGTDPQECSGIPPAGGSWNPPPGVPPSLGPWPVEELARLAAATPDPSEQPDPGSHLPTVLYGAVGAVELRGWVGRGILAVEGELVLGDGATISGVVMASGGVRLEAGATVVGMVRAGGGVRVEEGARLTGSPCTVREVLEALAPVLQGRTIPGGFPGSG